METKIRTCRHLMSSGRNCQSIAMRTSAYCYYHARLHMMKHHNYKVRKPLELPPLDSPHAILESLHKIMNLLLARKIDSPTAGRLLYGIQMASTKLEEQRNLNTEPSSERLIPDLPISFEQLMLNGFCLPGEPEPEKLDLKGL